MTEPDFTTFVRRFMRDVLAELSTVIATPEEGYLVAGGLERIKADIRDVCQELRLRRLACPAHKTLDVVHARNVDDWPALLEDVEVVESVS